MFDDIFNKMSPDSKEVLNLAREEAKRFNHNYVGTEHLLLGILKHEKNVAVYILVRMAISLTLLREAVEKKMGSGPEIAYAPQNIPFTPRVKKVLTLALKESREGGYVCVGPDHILVGILREGDGLAAQVLREFAVDIHKVRSMVSGDAEMQTPEQTPKTDMERVLKILNGSMVISNSLRIRLCDVQGISFTVIGKGFSCDPLLFACFMASAESDGYLGLKKLHSVIGEMLMKCEGEEKK